MINSNFEFFHYKDEPELEVEFHNHDFYEIYLFISGKVTYIVEGKSYSLKSGDILLVNNREIHKPVIEHGGIYERIVIWIKPEFIKRFCSEESDLLMCFESTSKNKYNLLRPGVEMLNSIKGIISKISRSYTQKAFGNDVLREYYMIELIAYLNRAYLETHIDDIEEDIIYDDKINDVLHYINYNLNEDLSLETLSSKFYTSKYHLLRQFKKHTGYTLHNYIHQKRLISAKALLKDGVRILDVCQECGFNDYSNFIRSFTHAFNISPKKYSRQFSKE
jgi:AraC-like DNA-binding protein